jgi:hypothetical protein
MMVNVKVSYNHRRVVEFLEDQRGINVVGVRGGGSVVVVDIDDCEGRFA